MTVKTQHLLREYKKETQTRYIILVTEGNRELHVGCLISIIEQAEERNAVWKMPTRCEICCEIMIAILIPPLGVCFRHGCCSVCFLSPFHTHTLSLSLSSRDLRLISFMQVEFIICLLLTILGYIPGIIYALYAIIFVDRDQYFDEYRRPLYAQY